MNFTKFPANTTNIFPIANSKTGGQLLTEFNLRSRESIITPEEIKYMVGPSYCHSQDDFVVRLLQDELGVAISSTTLEITEGRALVNGHFIESLVSVSVDLAEANRQLKSEGRPELKGKLAIGLRAMYSTEQTLSASMRVENNKNLVTGVQIVILPIGKIEPGYFVLPEDSPVHDELVTAHLKLAEFSYISGAVKSIENNEKKTQAIPASRIGSFEGLLSGHYVTYDNLHPKKLYTMAGKSSDGSTLGGKPTWCDSTDSLFVWDLAPRLKTRTSIEHTDYIINETPNNQPTLAQTVIDPTVLKQAEFFVNPSNQSVTLGLPHKSVDGRMWNAAGDEEFYDCRLLELPIADFATGKPGTVTSDYTKSVKAINEKISRFYHLPKGRQRGYLEVLDARTDEGFNTIEYDSTEEHLLPKLNQNWNPGDYILVGQDNTIVDNTNNLIQAPSSLYVVEPPKVTEITYQGYKTDINEVPLGHDGVEILRRVRMYPGYETDNATEIEEVITESFHLDDKTAYNSDFGISANYAGNVSTALRGMFKQISKTSVYALGQTKDGEATPPILLEGYEGTDTYYDYQDYVCLEIQNIPVPGTNPLKTTTRYYYFAVTKVEEGSKKYSEPILLTGTIPLATEQTIGGFYNVSDTDLDNGYVIRDGDGHLRLLDYSLIRSGVLAYQLGQDYEFSGTVDDIQNQLNEYVNERVAFPTEAQKSKSIQDGRNPNVIRVLLDIAKSDSANTLEIKNIDSRWGTCLHIIIAGEADNNTIINIYNCERLRLTLPEFGAGDGPVVNVYHSCLWYDASVIDYVHRCIRGVSDFTGFEDLTIWYEKQDTDDPNLILDGMTITEVNAPIIPTDIDFWSESVANDNHYYYGLHSITLDPHGNLTGCGLYMRNDLSANVEFGKSIAVAQFVLPQGSEFSYPETSLTKQIKITGQFITAYSTEAPKGYVVMNTQFTALTQKYLETTSQGNEIEKGTISFLSESEHIEDFIAIDGLEPGVQIDGWESNSYHIFKGWTIG